MVHLERKEWLWGWWRLLTNKNILFFVDQKTQGKWQEHRENSGNLVLIGVWQPWYVSVHQEVGVLPGPVLKGGGVPLVLSLILLQVQYLVQDRGYPARTGHAEGGTSLAITQEEFLVYY